MADDSAAVSAPFSAIDSSMDATPADSPPDIDAPSRDFFISRAGVDKDVALAIAGILREAGLTTWLQDDDFGPASFMAQLAEGWTSSKGMICLLSQAYQQSEYCKAEYEHALLGDPRNLRKRVIVLRLEDCEPIEHLARLAWVDLVPVLGDAEALAEVVRGAVLPDRFRQEADLASIHRRLPQVVLHDKVQAVPGFAGRTEELAAIEKGLWADGGGTVAVHGLGGVGKSSLAAEYAWRNRERYEGIWWVHADATLAEDLIDLGARFIPGLKEMKERGKAVRLTLDWLENGKHEKPWLLIYDNVEEPTRLKGLTPRSGAQVLITTPWSDWGKAPTAVPVGVLSEDEAAAYLLEATGRDDRAGAERLAATLGLVPLALNLAAACCRQTGLSFADYERLANELLANKPQGVEYDTPVFASVSLAIARADEVCPASQKLLGLSAYLAPDRIPLALFTTDVLTELERVDAVAALTAVSLVAPAPLEDGSQGIGIHRLVQAAMRDVLKDMGEHANAAALALELVADAYPQGDAGDVRAWPACDRLNLHALAVFEHAPDSGNGANRTAHLLSRTAINYVSRAAYDEAEPLMRRAVTILEQFERDTGHRHPSYEAIAETLAALESQVRSGGADKVADTAAAGADEPMAQADAALEDETSGSGARLPLPALQRGEEGGEGQPEAATPQQPPESNLDAPRGEGLPAPAAQPSTLPASGASGPVGASAVGFEADAPPQPAATTASDPENLTPPTADPESELRQALAAAEAAHGPDHPAVGDCLNRLGVLLHNENRHAEAEPLLRRALAISETSLGPTHLSVARDLDDLALLLMATERHAEADPLMRRALAIVAAGLGIDDLDVARMLNNLAQLLRETGRLAEAEVMMRRAVAILETFERTSGQRHPQHDTALANQAALEAQLAAAAPSAPIIAPPVAAARPTARPAAVPAPAFGAGTPPKPGTKATFLNWMFGRL